MDHSAKYRKKGVCVDCGGETSRNTTPRCWACSHKDPNRIAKHAAAMIGKNVGKRHPQETIDRISKKLKGRIAPNKGKPAPPHIAERLRTQNIGKPLTIEHRKNISLSYRGEKNHSWKGGITPLLYQIRYCEEMTLWREAVLKRDNYTCWMTGQHGGDLQVHHIIPFKELLKKHNITSLEQARNTVELWDIANGMTLSKLAHKWYHDLWGK